MVCDADHNTFNYIFKPYLILFLLYIPFGICLLDPSVLGQSFTFDTDLCHNSNTVLTLK